MVGWYNMVCRDFRNAWKWNPLDVDKMGISRIIRIHEELEEDLENQTEGNTI